MLLINKGNAQERTVGTLQKMQILAADLALQTSGTAFTSGTYTNPNWSNASSLTSSIAYSAGDILIEAFYQVVTPFTSSSSSLTNLTVQVGYKGTSNTSANAFVTATEIFASGYAAYSCGAGTSNGGGYSALETGAVSYTFTSTGAALSTLTAGEIDIYIYQKFAVDVYL